MPPQVEYDISKGVTSINFIGAALYPFGHGLSFTRFDDAGLEATGSPLTVTATVTNTVSRPGEETAQLYLVPPRVNTNRPRRMLRGCTPAAPLRAVMASAQTFLRGLGCSSKTHVCDGLSSVLYVRISAAIRPRQPNLSVASILVRNSSMSLFRSLFHNRFRRAVTAERAVAMRRAGRRNSVAQIGVGHLARLEPLEGRLLLALTIDATTPIQSYLTDKGYVFQDSDSITVASGATLDAFAGKNVTFDAPKITVSAGSRIVTTGKIDFTATKTMPNLPLSIWSQVTTIIQAFNKQEATITIAAGAHIEGKGVSFTANAGDSTPEWYKDKAESSATTFPFLGQFTSLIAQFANDLTSLPLSGIVKQPSAKIDIGTGVQIVSAGDVKAKASATADASGQAIWSVLMEKLTEHGDLDNKSNTRANYPFGLAAGVSYTDAQATTTVQSGASVQAGGMVSLATSTKNTAAMSSRVTLNQGVSRTNPNNVEVALAVTILNTTSKVHVQDNASIISGKSVEIVAQAQDKNKLKANTASYRDGLVGLVGGTAISHATVEARVDGRITANSSPLTAPLSFNPLFDVDLSQSAIRVPAAAGYQTGDAVVYSRSLGGAIPGLFSGETYYAIVIPAQQNQPTLLKLALTEADAFANRAIPFGRYPTLTTAKGTLPVTAVNAAGGNTLLFDSAKWPDDSPLFTDGEVVTFTPQAGQYLGTNAADGSLTGPLAAGQYRVRVVQPLVTDFEDYAIRLERVDTGAPVTLNDNPLFTTASGGFLQAFSFSAETAEIVLNFPRQGTADDEVPFPTPNQSAAVAALRNGDQLVYTQALGCVVPGLEDGRTYYAIVDGSNPGVIKLAETADQAAAANPAIQTAVPTLRIPAGQGADARVLEIGNVEPGTGLVFSADPRISDGTAVVYSEVPGRPIGGLVDGQTYYAYNRANAFFAENFPLYLLVLRQTPDIARPVIEMSIAQTLAPATGRALVIDGVDAVARRLSLELVDPTPITAATGAGLTGGGVSVAPVAAGSLQLYPTATGGTFTLVWPSPTGDAAANRTTAPLAFNASAAAVQQALQTALAGLADVSVTSVLGGGTAANPWLVEGTGIDTLYADPEKLVGGTIYGREVPAGVQRLATTATGGTFTLTLDVAGTPATTAPIAATATSEQVKQALDALPGVLATVWGAGTPESPWVIQPRHQPIATGDPLVFQDAAFTQTPGLLAGATYYAVVADGAEQGNAGSVVLGLARTRADALAATPVLLPLETNLGFEEPDQTVMSGTLQRIAPWIGQFLAEGTTTPGITVSAKLESVDSQALKAANGSEPKLKDLLSRGDFLPLLKPAVGSGAIPGLFTNLNVFADKDKNYKTPVSKLIEDKLGPQNKTNDNTFSVSGSYMGLTNAAHAIVGSKADLRASGSIDVTAEIAESIRTNVESTVSRPDKGNWGVAVATDILQIWNDAKAVIETNARVSGNGGVHVQSDIVYPWMGAITLDEAGGWGKFFRDNTISNFSKLIGGKLGVDEWFVNHWANAAVKEKEGKPIAKTVFGSVSWLGFYNTNRAQIEDGAQINQDAASGERGVSVTAATEMIQTGFAGNVYLDFSPDNAAKAIRAGKKFGNYEALVLSGGQTALGGSVGYVEMQNDTRALLGGQYDRGKDSGGNQIVAPAPTDATRVTFGDGGLAIDADNDVIYIQVSQSGGNAANTGFAGTASVLNLGSAPITGQVAKAAIVAAAKKAVIKGVTGTAGDVDVRAADQTTLVPIAGAVMFSKNKGTGMSTAIVELTRDVEARVGDNEGNASPHASDITAGGDITIEGTAAGSIVPVALAAAINSDIKVPGQPQQNANKAADAENPGNAPTSVWGWAISGDYSRGQVHDTVRAYVNDAGTVTAAGGSKSDRHLSLEATNDTVIAAAAGAATFTGSDDKNAKSFGLAGSAANIPAVSDVRAFVARTQISNLGLSVKATNSLTAVSAAAGGSATTIGNSAIAVAGSIAVNEIDYITEATVESLHGLQELHGLELTALTDHSIYAVAGSFASVGYGKAGADLDPGSNRIGIALGGGLNLINSGRADGGTRATLRNLPSVSVTKGQVGLDAADTSLFVTAASGAAIVRDGSANAGMFTTATVSAPVETTITNATLSIGTIFTTTTIPVVLRAAFTPLVISIAGNVLVSRADQDRQNQAYEGVGAAVTVTTVSGAARTKVVGSTIDIATTAPAAGSFIARAVSGPPPKASEQTSQFGGLYLPHAGYGGVGASGGSSDTPSSIYSFAIGATVTAAKVGANFAVTVNDIDIETAASVTGSTVTLASGSAAIAADNGSTIVAAAGAFAFGNPASQAKAKAAFGSAVARNRIAGATSATISAGRVESGPGAGDAVAVTAAAGRGIYAFAVGAQGAENSAGVSVTSNTIVGDVTTTIAGSETTAAAVRGGQSIRIEATSVGEILSLAGQVDIATKGLAAGAAAAVNDIDVSTIATVSQAVIETAHKPNKAATQHAAVTITATTDQSIKAFAVGVAGTLSSTDNVPLSFAGVGSGTGNTVVGDVLATVSNTTLGSATAPLGAVTLEAEENSEILAVAGALALGIQGTSTVSAAVGVSVATNTIGRNDRRRKVQAIFGKNSKVLSSGDIVSQATARPRIEAITAAGAGVFSGKQGTVAGIAGAGAGSQNEIRLDIDAALDSATVNRFGTASPSVRVNAANQSEIQAIAGGLAVAGRTTDGTSVNVTVGAAAAVNTIDLTTTARIDGSTVTVPGVIEVVATGHEVIKAYAFGVAGLLSGTSGVNFTGAGSATVNTVRSETTAGISGGAIGSDAAGAARPSSVTVVAIDVPEITAVAGAFDLTVFGGKNSASLALNVGVSFTINEVAGKAAATIQNQAAVLCAGDVSLVSLFGKLPTDAVPAAAKTLPATVSGAFGDRVATGKTTISTVVVAGSVAVGGGTDAGALAFPFAGAGSRNSVAFDTTATIRASTVNATGAVKLQASDTSAAHLVVGGVGLGVEYANIGGGIAIGYAFLQNTWANTIAADIADSAITAGSSVNVEATGKQNVFARGFGVALSAAVAEYASASIAGSGANLSVSLANTVRASASASSVIAAATDVTLSAIDAPSIDAGAGAGSLAVATGQAALSIAPGEITIDVTVANTVSAEAATSSTITAGGLVGLTATSKPTVTSLAVAAAAAVSLAEYGAAFAGAGSRATTVLNSNVTTMASGGTKLASQRSSGDGISLTARSEADVTATSGAGALAGAVVGAAIGVSLATVENTSTVTATTDAATLATSGGNVTVSATGQDNLRAMSVPVAAAVALGGAGAGGRARVNDAATFSAETVNGTIVRTRRSGQDPLPGAPDGTLSVTADSNQTVHAEINGGAGGLGSIGVFFADATRSGATRATLRTAGDLNVGGVSVAATTDHAVEATGFSVTIGGLTGSGQTNTTTIDEQVAATWDDSTRPRGPEAARMITGSVAVKADASSNARSQLTGVNADLLGVGIYTAVTTIKPTVSSSLVSATLAAVGTLEVSATQSGTATARATAGSGGLLDGNAALTTLTQAPTVSASVSGSASAGVIKVRATSQSDYDSYADSIQAAVVGASGARSTNTLTPVVATTIDTGTTFAAASGMTVAADGTIQRTGGRDAVKIGAGGLANGYIGSIDTNITATTTVNVKDDASLTVLGDGRMDVRGRQTASIDEAVRIDNGGVIAVGVVKAAFTGTLTTNVTFGAATLTAPVGTIDIGTRATATVDTNASATTFGLAGAVVSSAEVDLTSNESVTLPRGATIFGGDSVSLAAGSYDFGQGISAVAAHSLADSEAVGLIEIPHADASAKVTASTKLDIAGLTKIVGGGDLRLAATMPTASATARWHTAWNGTFNSYGFSGTATPTATAILGGTFVAGAYHDLGLLITQDNATDPAAWVTTKGYDGAVRPFAAQLVPQFDPRAALDAAPGISTESKGLVRDYLSSSPVSAISLDKLKVGGGQVVIEGTVTGAGTIQAFAPSMKVENSSDRYLILGSLTAAGGSDTGTVVVNGKLQSPGKVNGVTVTPFANGVKAPTIAVALTHPGPTGTSTDAGPALFLEGEISNPTGGVTLRNDYGAFVDLGPITAETLTITVPNGPVAITTTGYFGVGGSTWRAWEQTATPLDPTKFVAHAPGNFNQSVYAYPETFFFPGWTTDANDKANVAAATAAVVAHNMNPDGTWKNTSLNPWTFTGQMSQGPSVDVYFGSFLPGYAFTSQTYAVEATKQASGGIFPSQYTGSQGWYYTIGQLQNGNVPVLLPNLPTRAQASLTSASTRGVFDTIGQGGIVAAQLSIKADIIDLNAPITAGTVTANRSLNITTSDQTQLLAYRDRYLAGTTTERYYFPPSTHQFERSGNSVLQGDTTILQSDTSGISIGQRVTGPGIPFGSSVTSVAADRFRISQPATVDAPAATLVFMPPSTTLPWRYDAELNRIEILDFTASTGKVSVILDGKIMATTDRGRVTVRGGVGTFTVDAAGSIPVVVGEVLSSSSATEATVQVFDRAKGLQTLYVYTGLNDAPDTKAVSIYTGSLDDKDVRRNTPQRVGVGEALIQPLVNQRFIWDRSTDVYRVLQYDRHPNEDSSSRPPSPLRPEFPIPPWEFMPVVRNEPNDHGWYSAGYDKYNVHTGKPDDPIMVETVSTSVAQKADYRYEPNNWVVSHPFELYMGLSASIKADFPVPVDFSGYRTSGTFRVTAGSDIILGDSVTFPGWVSLTAGSNAVNAPVAGIAQTPGGVLAAGSITLTSNSGSVGSRQTPINVSVGDSLSAHPSKDGAYLVSAGALTLWDISAATGDPAVLEANVSADGGIFSVTDGNAGVKLGTVRLRAAAGSIGTAARPLDVQLASRRLADGSLAGGVLDASAYGDITVRSKTADLRLGIVASSTGDVSLSAVAGSILDARDLTPQGVSASGLSLEKAEAALARITERDAASAANTVLAFEQNVDRNYALYWMLRRYGTVEATGQYVPQADAYDDLSVQLGLASIAGTPSNEQEAAIALQAQAQYDQVANGLADALGPAWQSQPQFGTFDPTYTFSASASQRQQLTDGADANIASLALASIRALSVADPDAPPAHVTPNISGRNITLSAGGSIGVVSRSAVLPLDKVRLGQLTAEERELLALADTAGELMFQGTDASGRAVTFGYGQTPPGVTPTALVLSVDEPLFVEATGTLSADTKDSNGGITIEQTNGALTVGTIQTDGNVRLAAPGFVRSVQSQSPDITGFGTNGAGWAIVNANALQPRATIANNVLTLTERGVVDPVIVNGFGNNGSNWNVVEGNPVKASSIANNILMLTESGTGNVGMYNGVWYKPTIKNLASSTWKASFVYTNVTRTVNDGGSFMIQAAGDSFTGDPNHGSNTQNPGVPALRFSWDTYVGGRGGTRFAVTEGGGIPQFFDATNFPNGINLVYDSTPCKMVLEYDGAGGLKVTLTQGSKEYTLTKRVNLRGLDSNVNIGFVGGNGLGTATTTISDFHFEASNPFSGTRNAAWHQATFNGLASTPWVTTFRYANESATVVDGGSFMIQKAGPSFIGDGWYGSGQSPALRFSWNNYNDGRGGTSVAVTVGSAEPQFEVAEGINLATSSTPCVITIAFNGTDSLTVTMTQGSNSYRLSRSLSLAGLDSGATVGFVGGEGAATATTKVSDFSLRFIGSPVTGMAGIDLVAGGSIGGDGSNPLPVVSKGPVNAFAGGDIWLRNGSSDVSFPLRLGTVEAGGNATIVSVGPIEAGPGRTLDATISGFDIDAPADAPAWVVNEGGEAADGRVALDSDSLVFEKTAVSIGLPGGTPMLTPQVGADWVSPPTDVTATASVLSATLTWQAPVSLGPYGAQLLGYTISYQEGDNPNWHLAKINTDSTATRYVVDSLKAGTPYRFKVAAYTNQGMGQESAPTGFITPRLGNDGVSTWYRDALPIEHGFSASFVYTGTGSQGGMTFLLQADPRGTAAVGAGASLGAGGTDAQRIRPSVGLFISLGDPGRNIAPGVAIGLNGEVDQYIQPGSVDLTGGRRVLVTVNASPFVTYERDPGSGATIERHRTTLAVTLVDIDTNVSFGFSRELDDLTVLLGSSVGSMGFTAGFGAGQ